MATWFGAIGGHWPVQKSVVGGVGRKERRGGGVGVTRKLGACATQTHEYGVACSTVWEGSKWGVREGGGAAGAVRASQDANRRMFEHSLFACTARLHHRGLIVARGR
jgi:hypothetical protein